MFIYSHTTGVIICCKQSVMVRTCSQSSSVLLTMPKSNRRLPNFFSQCTVFVSAIFVHVCGMSVCWYSSYVAKEIEQRSTLGLESDESHVELEDNEDLMRLGTIAFIATLQVPQKMCWPQLYTVVHKCYCLHFTAAFTNVDELLQHLAHSIQS